LGQLEKKTATCVSLVVIMATFIGIILRRVNMKLKNSSILFLLVFLGFLINSVNSQTKKIEKGDSSKTTTALKPQSTFDSILVIHFHPTVQCSCCINVGDFAKEGLKKDFTKLFESKKILYRKINFETDTLKAKKYHIVNSALVFDKFSHGKENFKEIFEVWELCEDKKGYLEYFKSELSSFLEPKREEKKGEVK
jgi:hypothetical protein